jgi:hypothetical protein
MASLPLTLVLLLAAPADIWDAAPKDGEAREPREELEDEAGDEDANKGCPLLFGSDESREHNRAVRLRRLAEVTWGEKLTDLVHSEPTWREPVLRRVPGLEVVQVEAVPDGEHVALVRVSEAFAASCPAGDYLVSVDDALGAEGAVLAVLDEGLLAELRGDLIFLHRGGAPPLPRFRMIWRSSYGLSLGSAAVAATGGKSAAPAARAARAQARQRGRVEPTTQGSVKERAVSTRRPQPRG